MPFHCSRKNVWTLLKSYIAFNWASFCRKIIEWNGDGNLRFSIQMCSRYSSNFRCNWRFHRNRCRHIARSETQRTWNGKKRFTTAKCKHIWSARKNFRSLCKENCKSFSGRKSMQHKCSYSLKFCSFYSKKEFYCYD